MTTSFMPFGRVVAVMLLTAVVLTTCLSADFTSFIENKNDSSIATEDPEQPACKPISRGKHAYFAQAKPAIAPARKQRQAIRVVATGYTAGIESTGKKPGHPQYGITYSGVKVRRAKVSTIAADPKIFPIGTLLYVPGYGYGVVADTGSAIKGKKIDLYFETRKQVFKQWGKRTVDVQIIKEGQGKLSEAWIDALNKVASAGKSIPESLLKS